VKFWPANARAHAPERLRGTLAPQAFSPDGRHLLIMLPGGKTALHAWPSLALLGSVEIGIPMGFLPANGAVLGIVESTGPSPQRVAREWSVPDFKPGRATKLPGAEDEAHRLSLSDDGRWLTGVTALGRVRVWNLADGGRPVSLAGPVGTPAISVFVMTNPPTLAVGCEIGPHLRLFSLPDGRALGPLLHYGGPPGWMLAADGGRALITECASSIVRKLNVAARSEEWRFSEDSGPIALSPDGTTLACGAAGGTVRLWHLPTLREIARFTGYQRITRLAFAPDGTALLLSEADGGTQILRAADLATADTPAPK
jgi:WD40 repeat protein